MPMQCCRTGDSSLRPDVATAIGAVSRNDSGHRELSWLDVRWRQLYLSDHAHRDSQRSRPNSVTGASRTAMSPFVRCECSDNMTQYSSVSASSVESSAAGAARASKSVSVSCVALGERCTHLQSRRSSGHEDDADENGGGRSSRFGASATCTPKCRRRHESASGTGMQAMSSTWTAMSMLLRVHVHARLPIAANRMRVLAVAGDDRRP